MSRHIVCLTFDFDAVSSWIARGLTTPTPISRGEFGVVGAKRILKLLKKHGIRTTWFIPGHTIETYPDVCKRVVDDGHEIGHHGWTHVPPARFTREEEEAELVRANRAIGHQVDDPFQGKRLLAEPLFEIVTSGIGEHVRFRLTPAWWSAGKTSAEPAVRELPYPRLDDILLGGLRVTQ